MAFRSVVSLRAALKSSATFGGSRIAASCLLLVAPLFAVPAFANPVDGTVTSGSATISSPSSHRTTVDQNSEGVVIDWSSFDIGAGQTTQFVQPDAQAIAINRIGGGDPAQIMGNLDANGRIVLIDGNGIVFGQSSRTNVGSLVATSNGGSDANLLAGKFNRAGNPQASIVNQGVIDASQGGLVALVAPHVSSSGIVRAKLGTVALGGANKFTVDFAGDGLVSFAGGDVAGAAGVANTGRLSGANVSLTAKGAEGIAAGVVTMSGTIVARSAHNEGGTIVLDAGNGGDVSVSNARLDASGAAGGGTIRIGGRNENSVTIDKSSVIDASATASGNGGTIETSGHSLAFGGALVDASAAHGRGGRWLLDPYDLTVDSAAATTIDNSLTGGTGVTLQTTATGTSGPGTANPSGNGDIVIDAALSWHGGAKLTLDAYHSIFIDAPMTVTGVGNLAMLTNDGGTGGDLFFNGGTVAFNNLASALAINGADYALVRSIAALAVDIAADPSGDYALAGNYRATNDGTYTSSPISTPFAGIFEGLGNTISNLTIDDTTDSNVGLFAAIDGGSVVRDIVLSHVSVTGTASGADVGGLIGSMAANSSVENASVSGKISSDAAFCSTCGLTGVGGLVGSSLGSIAQGNSSARVQGNGEGRYTGGLVGTDSGTVTNSYATGEVSGDDFPRAGGLVGFGGEETIDNSYATGAVIGGGNAIVGGLVGLTAEGAIDNSYATGAASGASGSTVGGLVGLTSGTIENSYATGNVTGREVGGLAGAIQGSDSLIDDSYATGSVSDRTDVWAGGLVGGVIETTITDSYATGAVSGAAGSWVGGLVGYGVNETIDNSYATGAVSADAGADIGGLVGYSEGHSITNSYATGAVTDGGKSALIGGLVGMSSDTTISYSYAAGALSGRTGAPLGGMVGYNDGSIYTDNYWDVTTSGIANLSQGAGNIANDPGITGLTTAQFQSGLPAGFDPTIWGEQASINGGLPYLLALPPS